MLIKRRPTLVGKQTQTPLKQHKTPHNKHMGVKSVKTKT